MVFSIILQSKGPVFLGVTVWDRKYIRYIIKCAWALVVSESEEVLKK